MKATTTPTRERIIYASAELFRRQGYPGTGLKQVVAEAQAPFGSLYHHFPGGKQQLAEEVIRAGGAFFQALVTGVYDEESTARPEVFEQWTVALTDRLGDRDYAMAVLSALEGAFVLCRARRSVEPMLAAGKMAAAHVAGA